MALREPPRRRPALGWRCGAIAGLLVMILAAPEASLAGGAEQGRVEASLMGVAALSAPQMAGETGAGLSVPILKPTLGQSSAPRVTLWDEPPQTNPQLNQGQSSIAISVHVVP